MPVIAAIVLGFVVSVFGFHAHHVGDDKRFAAYVAEHVRSHPLTPEEFACAGVGGGVPPTGCRRY